MLTLIFPLSLLFVNFGREFYPPESACGKVINDIFPVKINGLLKTLTLLGYSAACDSVQNPFLENLLPIFSVAPQHPHFSLLFPPTSQSLDFLKNQSFTFSSLLYTNFSTKFHLLGVYPINLMMKNIKFTFVLLVFNLYPTSIFPNTQKHCHLPVLQQVSATVKPLLGFTIFQPVRTLPFLYFFQAVPFRLVSALNCLKTTIICSFYVL